MRPSGTRHAAHPPERSVVAFGPTWAQSGEVTRTNRLAPRTDHVTDLAPANEPPVVARLWIEIRSDGNLTVARGALEDAQLDERTSLEVKGATPFQLTLSLVKALFQAPAFARSVAQALLTERTKEPTGIDGVRDRVPARPSRRGRAPGEPRRSTGARSR
jgi:hypothetical protein